MISINLDFVASSKVDDRKKILVTMLPCLFLCGAAVAASPASTALPNVLFVLVDDLGYAEIGESIHTIILSAVSPLLLLL